MKAIPVKQSPADAKAAAPQMTAPKMLEQLIPGSTFEAGGKKYIVAESFTIGRFERVEEMEEELLQFADQKTCHQTMLAAMKEINKMNPGEAYRILYNKVENDQRNSKIIHYSLKLCTAYINFDGEDLRYLTDEIIKQKIDDWSREGLDVRPFLLFAVSVFHELMQHYSKPIQDILRETHSIKESINQALDLRSLMKESSNGSEKPENVS